MSALSEAGSAVPDHPLIGILGGMGPEATVDLMRRVIAATPAADDVDHIHLLVDNNPKIPSRIAALIEGGGESPAAELQRMTRGLVAAGADAIAMPCNTAHNYLGAIRAAAGAVPVLDMVALTARRAGELLPGGGRVGMLASTAVQLTGLYADELGERGVDIAFPLRQAELMQLIRDIKRGRCGAAERRRYAEICNALRDDGAKLLLVACTELSILADTLPAQIPSLDALDVLTAEIVAVGTAPGQRARAAESGA